MEFFLQMSIPQWIATLISLIYIFFAVRNKSVAFFFGLIASSFWAYEDFVNLNLKFDGALQVFYIIMSIYGIYSWKYGGQDNKELKISRLSPNGLAAIIVSGVVVSVLSGWAGQLFFNTNLPYLDALTTGFSIIATFLLVKRYIDNWIFWMVINPLYIYIYMRSEAYLFVGIMVIYTVLSISGYLNWRKLSANKT